MDNRGKKVNEYRREDREKDSREKTARPAKKATSRCSIYKKCGGCTLLHLPYEEQLKKKQERIDALLADLCVPEPVLKMKNPDHYRAKVTSVFSYDRKGRPVCGIYREGSHEVVPVKTCMLEDLRADRIVQTVFELLPSFRIRVYDEDLGTGLLRYVQVRTARKTGQIMVTLVTADPIFPSRNNFVKALRKQHPEITTIVQNINPEKTTMVLGERERVLFGKGYIEEEVCGCRFRLSSRSFFQVNPIQTEKLYNIAVDMAGLSGKETVLDAYCGVGTIGIIAASRCRQVLSVELNPEAVRNARDNVLLNGCANVQVMQGDAGQFMRKMAGSAETAAPDVLFLDPPRSGASEAFLEASVQLAPAKLVYVSCDPETLARDLGYLTAHGYRVKKAVPVDMFPHTDHVETVCLLTQDAVAKNV
jgi:23S rRNA (uracil1939-C5)-methyltransferase